MTNTVALREWIASHGIKYSHICNTLGISYTTLQRKIDNETEFKASEIASFVNTYSMEKGIRDAIFFCPSGDESAT